MSGRLTGRVALVTGAPGGIDRANASGLAAQGASVAALDIANGSGTVAQIEAAGTKGPALAADMADPDQVTAAGEAEAALGAPDILAGLPSWRAGS